MAGFKNLNTENPALLRPYKLADLQYLWEAISLIVGTRGDQNTPTIVWGLNKGENGKLTVGVIAYNGELFYYDGSAGLDYPLSLNSINFALVKKAESQRVFSDKTVQPFYYNNVVTNIYDSQTDTVVATFDFVTAADIVAWKANFGVANSIRSEMFSFACVTSNALAEGSVTTQKIAEDAITSDKIDYHTISEQNLGDSIVSNRTIQAGAITDDKIDQNGLSPTSIKNSSFIAPSSIRNSLNIPAGVAYQAPAGVIAPLNYASTSGNFKINLPTDQTCTGMLLATILVSSGSSIQFYNEDGSKLLFTSKTISNGNTVLIIYSISTAEQKFAISLIPVTDYQTGTL